jgi:two-component system chemotaxis response regulator CheY
MLTALGDKPHLVTGLKSGADDYLTKPYDPHELLARVAIAERILKLEERLLESNRQMEQLAMLDTLTGLLNRRAVTERAEAELSRLRRGGAGPRAALSLVMLDLDYLKPINDTFGHALGDAALRAVAQTLTQSLRQYDAAGRWGGDEFLVVLPGTGLAEAVVAAERVHRQIRAARVPLPGGEAGGLGLPLGASLGVAGVTAAEAAGLRLDELVRRADEALYAAKANGRNCVWAGAPK